MKGFATAMSKPILTGCAGEVAVTVKTDLKHLRELV